MPYFLSISAFGAFENICKLKPFFLFINLYIFNSKKSILILWNDEDVYERNRYEK